MFNVLCYGDSNTHGYNSESGSRYDIATRWTGRLAAALGADFHIIEAGTNGMTVGFDEADLGMYMNGTKCLPAYLLSQRPLDAVVVMLGTNDTKAHFRSSAPAVAENLRGLIRLIKGFPDCAATGTKIIVIAPVPLIIKDPPFYDMDAASGVISRALATEYRRVAAEEGVVFADAADWGIELNPDGCHLSRAGHYRFAKRLEALLRKTLCGEE